jgi:hypothetical protein
MSKCERVRELLALYVRDELEKPEHERVEAHVELCAGCRAEMETMRRLGTLLDTALKGPQVDVRSKVLSRVKGVLEDSEMDMAYPVAVKRGRVAVPWRLVRIGAVAAAVIIAVVSILHFLPQGPKPPQWDLLGIASAGEEVKTRMSKHYKPVKVDTKATMPQYELPVKLEEVMNLDKFNRYLGSDAVKGMLRKNGFVVLPPTGQDNMVGFYQDLKKKEIHPLVTTDALLHLFHMQFDTTLREIEEREFYRDICALTNVMLNHFVNKSKESEGELKRVAQHNIAFFAVALMLLDGEPLLGKIDTVPIRQDLAEGAWGTTGTDRLAEVQKVLVALPGGMLTPDERKTVSAAIPAYGNAGKIVTLYERLYKAMNDKAQKVRKTLEALPGHLRSAMQEELRLIGEHQGFAKSPLFAYMEDYGQYVPRGHYTYSEALKRYFKAMMWYGRIAFLMKGGELHGPDKEYLISSDAAKRQTLQACLISRALDIKTPDDRKVSDIWERIYSVMAYYVGLADDLTPYDYRAGMDAVFGKDAKDKDLLDQKKILDLRKVLARLRSAEIYGGTGRCEGPPVGLESTEDLGKALGKTTGMRLMGQRFVPDSYIMGQLVYPTVGGYIGEGSQKPFTFMPTQWGDVRGFPRGLDVMAVLGSGRALDVLKAEGDTEYIGYFERKDPKTGKVTGLNVLKKEFAQLSEGDFNRNLYWSWLWVLKGLLNQPEDYKGYQSFQQTQAWIDRQLNAALGSWSQLRHDTILFVKQSFTPRCTAAPPGPPKPKPKPVAGYVEPEPEFFARLLALTRMTLKGLDDMKVLSGGSKGRLQSLEKLIKRALDILIKEMKNKELNKEDEKFLRDFVGSLKGVIVSGANAKENTTIVADVHTDPNANMCLEEGTGYIRTVIVICKLPNGGLQAFAGPAFSYYEFKHPVSDRLTDEKWRKMLRSKPPALPDWTSSFSAK